MDVTAAKVERIKVEKDWTKHLLLNVMATSQCHLNDFEAFLLIVDWDDISSFEKDRKV